MSNEEKQFLTKAKFAKLVEEIVRRDNQTYIDAVIVACEENEVDLEDARKFISPIIKNKLEAEAMSLNFLPKQNTLPVD